MTAYFYATNRNQVTMRKAGGSTLTRVADFRRKLAMIDDRSSAKRGGVALARLDAKKLSCQDDAAWAEAFDEAKKQIFAAWRDWLDARKELRAALDGFCWGVDEDEQLSAAELRAAKADNAEAADRAEKAARSLASDLSSAQLNFAYVLELDTMLRARSSVAVALGCAGESAHAERLDAARRGAIFTARKAVEALAGYRELEELDWTFDALTEVGGYDRAIAQQSLI